MKVSVVLHKDEPDHNGNQRQVEAAYGGYNRQYADLVIDPETGMGVCDFNVTFPQVQNGPEHATHFSLGLCYAPPCQGGSIIIASIIDGGKSCNLGETPNLCGAALIVRDRLIERGVIVPDGDQWGAK